MITKLWKQFGLLIVLIFMISFSLISCSNKIDSSIENSQSTTESLANENLEKEGTLVAYFSATGTTKEIAEKIANLTNADLYEILPAQPYTSEDLDWKDANSRTTQEQNDSLIRPEIASEPLSLDTYSTIYIGYPIWWGEEPRILDTFVESYDFEEITIIPFCTSSSSGIGQSEENLAQKAGSGNWLEGQRFSGNTSEDTLESWIQGY